ncbi:MAG: 4-alpha-glucanotransferase, partial [Muribaculum sp.]|nr:4-alpha-glucanotransferase [Muribaculum sp.]
MKLNFSIDYRTTWGESLYLTGSRSQGDTFEISMDLAASGRWMATLEFAAASTVITYAYEVRRDDGSVRREWGNPRRLTLPATLRILDINDRWQDIPADKNSYSALFTEVVNRRDARDKKLTIHGSSLLLSVQAPMVGRDEVLGVVGDSKALGEWNPEKAVIMNDCDFPVWTVEIERKHLPDHFQFKFVVLSRDDHRLIAWEGGENRSVYISASEKNAAVLFAGMRFYDVRPHWRGAGVAIPVFSVRSEEDFGVGDFYDLIKVVDWAVETGQSVLQILPINDTTMTHTWTDSYPYNACSTFALHPMYMRLSELGPLASPTRQAYFDDLARQLNALPAVDYERVNNAKREYIAEAFAIYGSETMRSAEFTDFMVANGYWLRPYAAFCVLRDLNGTPDFTRWGEYAEYKADTVDRIYAEHTAEMNLVYYTQFHLDRQMRHVHEYASRNGVAFKGDIPIGISRHSADAWLDPRLFNIDCQAGAPPDDFSIMGQNWGFPTYNWEEMSRDGFAWWKARFRKMADYFDAYRIDHVLGFFRIWEIPMNA